MKPNLLNRRIMLDLFKAEEGLFVFTLYNRYSVPPRELYLSILYLKNNGIVSQDGERLMLSHEGREFIIKHKVITKSKPKKFARIPNEFIGRIIGINEFYLPTSKEIIKELFL